MSSMADSGRFPPESTQGVEVSPEDAKRALRRRILKAGAIGAPLIVTLQGNSAWAASMTCIQHLKVPKNIDTKDIGHSDASQLVPYDQFNKDHQKYIHALQTDPTMNGMPGYSCVASIMTRA
jgi:hypothetical protein